MASNAISFSATSVDDGAFLRLRSRSKGQSRAARLPGDRVRGVSLAEYVPPSQEEIGAALSPLLQEFGGYCRGLFERLAETNGRVLASLVAAGDLPSYDLTFAAEVLGSVEQRDWAIEALCIAIRHESALVREGALYGLVESGAVEVLPLLRVVSEVDPSAAVREATLAAIEALG